MYCQVDLASAASADAVVFFLDERGIGHIDLLIHNAGIGYIGAIAAQPSANIRQLIAVNLLAPLALTHVLVPRLRLAGGKVVLISSVVSALPAPNYAVYAATKAALDSLARNLRIEWEDTLAVQVIHPGATRTGMHHKAGGDPARMGWSRFPPAEQVALQIADAIATNQPRVTLGVMNRFTWFAGVWLGGVVDRFFAWQSAKTDR
jgi:short-subunit dehydrogenase